MPSLACPFVPDNVTVASALLSTPCPPSRWADALAEASYARLSRAPGPLTFLNIGANKGYAIAEFVDRWTQRRSTPHRWHDAILEYAKETHHGTLHHTPFLRCGVCHACKNRAVPPHARAAKVAVHALELLDENREIIRWAANATGIADMVTVHNLAGSNATSKLTFHHTGRAAAGKEGTSACTSTMGCDRAPRGLSVKTVQAMSVDDLMGTLGLSEIYHVSIDVEGWDALVVEGMRGAISRRAVEVFEFEYKRSGYWTHVDPKERRGLGELVAWVSEAGYRCYWQSATALVRVSGECWSPHFAGVGWSNLLCAHRPHALAILDRGFGFGRGSAMQGERGVRATANA